MPRDTEGLIGGGGLNGAARSLALASGGVASIVLDAAPREIHADPDFDGRAYALALVSRRMLTALGIWRGIEAQAQPILDIKVSDGRPGEGASPLHLHFAHHEIAEGPMGPMIEDRYLRRALIAAMDAEPRIDRRAGVRVVDQTIDAGSASVTLYDGTRRSGTLIIGCDGRGSAVAKRAGIGRLGHDYQQTGLVCAVEHELSHHGIAHQLFMPAGPLAILPLPGNRSSIVWAEARADAEAISRLDPDAYLARLRPRFGEFLGEIALTGKRHAYPLGLSLADSFTAPRVALAGDAAHGIHPLAGQGLNLGLRDVAALAQVLVEARRRGQDPGAADVLEDYARWRRADTAALAVATDGLNRLFSNDNPLLRLGRDLGLGLVNRLPPVRRALIREAAGLTGELPRLMRGRPI